MKYTIESQLGPERFARLVAQARGHTADTLDTAARERAARFFPVDSDGQTRLLAEPLHTALATQEALRLAGSNATSDLPLLQAARKGSAEYEQALAERHGTAEPEARPKSRKAATTGSADEAAPATA